MYRAYKAFLLFCVFISPVAHSGSPVPSSFAEYVKVEVHEHDIHGKEARAVGEIFHSPELRFVKIDSNDIDKYGIPNEFSVYKTKIHDIDYVFSATSGLSEDYGFIVGALENGKFKIIGEVGGSRIFISQKGLLYSDLNDNHYFDLKQKFEMTPSALVEIKQPILYINKICNTTASAALKSAPEKGSKIVARIPEGQSVTVIGTNYASITSHEAAHEVLISTPFGLTGWVTTELGWSRTPGSPIDCVKYVGD